MSGLRWALAFIIGVIFAALIFQNLGSVTVTLLPGEAWTAPLPVLLLIAFAAGAFPMWVWATARRLHWKGRAGRAEAKLTSTLGPGAIEDAA